MTNSLLLEEIRVDELRAKIVTFVSDGSFTNEKSLLNGVKELISSIESKLQSNGSETTIADEADIEEEYAQICEINPARISKSIASR
jgi:hypothetical protein